MGGVDIPTQAFAATITMHLQAALAVLHLKLG